MSEKTVWLIARLIIGIIGAAFVLLGFIVKPNPSEGTLWDAMHPASFVNYAGVGLFSVFVIALTGILEKIIESLFPNYNVKGVTVALTFCGVLGIILMFV